MPSPVMSFRRLPHDAQLYAWAWFLFGFGYFGVFSVLFNLYLRRLGLGTETIGFVMAAGSFAWGVGAIPAGMIGARIGNRQAMILGAAIIVAATVLLVCVGFVPAGIQVAWLTTWYVITWLGNSLNFVNGAPFVMEVTTSEQRGDAFTAQVIMENVGGSIGSLFAGVLPVTISMLAVVAANSATAYWLSLWIVPVSYFGALCMLMLTRPRAATRVAPAAISSARLPLPILLFVVLVTILLTSGEGLIRPFFNLYLDAQLLMPLSQIGLIFGIAQALPIFSALAAPWLIRRFGTGRVLIAIGIANSLCFLMLALMGTQLVAAVGYITFMSIVPIAGVVSIVFTQEIVEARWRTAMNTAYTIGLAMGSAAYASLGGIVITRLSYGALFFTGAFLALLFAVLIWGYLHRGGNRRSEEIDQVVSA